MCIINIAEELGAKINLLTFIENCIERNYVDFNFDNYNDSNNFYVNQPAKILELATGKKWTVEKQSPKYEKKQGEYLVEFWTVNGSTGHFARLYKGYNSLQKSICCTQGHIGSYRVFKEVK